MSTTHSFEIELAGETLTQADPKGITTILMEDHVDMMGMAQITVGIGGVNWASIVIGDEVTVSIGAGDRQFKGHITEVRHLVRTGVQSLVVTVMDPLVFLASSRHTRVYEESTDSDIVSSVLSDAGVTSGTVDSTSESRAYVFQRNESDFAFLKRIAARNGFQLRAEEGEVSFQAALYSGESIEITFDELVSLDYTMTNQQLPPSLSVYGWDYVAKESVIGSAEASDLEDIGGGDNAVNQTGAIWQEDSYVSDVLVQSQDSAKEMAVGELSRLSRGFLRGRAVMESRGDIYAGALIKFTGFSAGFNPEGYVISVRHTINTAGTNETVVRFVSNTVPE